MTYSSRDKQMTEPSSQNVTRMVQFYTHTHCLNTPAQRAVTHSPFLILACLVGAGIFCLFPCESHTHTHTLALSESLSTVIHFFGNDLLRPAQRLSTMSRAKHNTRLENTIMNFGPNNENIGVGQHPFSLKLRWAELSSGLYVVLVSS